MTRKPKTRKAPPVKGVAPHVITGAEWAAMNFEPWEGEVDTKMLPDNEQFAEAGLSNLIICRMALVMMYRNKAELSEMFEQDGHAMCDLVDDVGRAKNFFSYFSKLLDAASARLITAGSSVCQNTPEKCGQRGREWGNA